MKFRSVFVLGILLARWAAAEVSCTPDSYSQSGENLPPLIKAAADVLAKVELDGLPAITIEKDQILVISDFDRFVACRGFADPAQIEWVRKAARMFTMGAVYPIYVGGFRRDFGDAVEEYRSGRDYFKYLYAAWIAHEWAHAEFREQGELFPYQTELRVELYFVARGFLPKEQDNPYIADTRSRLDAVAAASRQGNLLIGPMISLGSASDARLFHDQAAPQVIQAPPDGSMPPDEIRSLADMTIPAVVRPGPIPLASARKLVQTWNRLIAGFKEASEVFSPDENVANDAILTQIEGNLLALGCLRVVPAAVAKSNPENMKQLVPNANALEQYLARKVRENPKSKQFRKLHTYSQELSNEVGLIAPIRSVITESAKQP